MMNLEAKHCEWLNEFTSGAIPRSVPGANGNAPAAPPDLASTARRERTAEQGRKKAILDEVWGRLDKEKDAIRTACGLQAPRRKAGFRGKLGQEEMAQLRDPDGRQENAIEAGNISRLAGVPTRPKGQNAPEEVARTGTGIDGKRFKMANSDLSKAGDAMNKVHAERDLLIAAKAKRTVVVNGVQQTKEERLFTDDEIATLLYEPLVREKIIPETLVPNKFSVTQKMIEGSNEYYLKDCKANPGGGMPTGFATLAKDLAVMGAGEAAAVLTAMGPVKAGGHKLDFPAKEVRVPERFQDHDTVAQLTDYAIAGGAAVSLAADGASLADDILHSDDSVGSSWQAVLNDVGLTVGKLVSKATGNAHIGLAVADGVSGLAAGGNFLAEIVHARRTGAAFPVDVLLSQLGTALAAPLRGYSDMSGGPEASATARAGDAVEPVLKSAAAAVRSKLGMAATAGDWKTVKACLLEMGTLCAKAAPNLAKLDEVTAQPGSFYQVEKRSEGQGKAIDAASAAGDAVVARAGAAEAGPSKPWTKGAKRRAAGDAKMEELFQQKQEELAKALQVKQGQEAEAIEAKLAKEQAQFEASLASLGGGGGDSLAKLAEQLERDQKTWETVEMLFAAVPGVAGGVITAMNPASEALGPIKSAAQAVAFCSNVASAHKRRVAWRKWLASQQDAENAVSPYVTAIENFASSQGAQFAQHTTQAIGNLIQTVLAVFELSPMQPVFKLAGATTNAGFALEQALYKFFHQRTLRNAWATTREAFDPKNQGDRNLGLMARKLNPTLAKYTVAYGALVEKSPVAIAATNRIGIERDTLANETDGVVALKTYLAKLYPEDGVVTGLFDPVSRQKAPPRALRVKTWAMTYVFWTKHLGLATANPPGVTGLLGVIEPLHAEWEAAGPAERPALAARLEPLLQKLRSALVAFQPVNRDKKPVPAIAEAVRAYVELADDALTGLALPV